MARSRGRIFVWLLRHRYAVLAMNALLIALAGFGASRVPTDYTMEQFFPGWGPERERFDRYKLTFPKVDTRITLFWADSRPAGLDVYRGLERVAGIFDAAGLRDVRWLGSVEVAESVDVDGESVLDVRPLVESGAATDETVRKALGRHRDDALLRAYLWNEDQSAFAVHGTLAPEVMADDAARRDVEERLEKEIDGLRGDGRTLVLNGIPIIRSRVPKLLDEDQRRLVTAGLAVFLVVLFLFFRHLGQVVLCLVSIVPAYLCTVSLIGFAGKPVTVMTGFIPIIVLVVGGSDIVHVLSRYRRRRAVSDNVDAIVRSFAEMSGPCFYTSLTTGIGFASLAGTRIQLLVDFGLFTATAIFLTYLFSMTLLPVLLSFYRGRSLDDRGLGARWIFGVVEAAAGLASRRPRKVLVLFGGAAALAVVLGSRVRVDSHLVDDLNERSQLLRDLRWIEDVGFSVFQVNIHMRQDGQTPLHHPASLAWMEEFQRYVRDDPIVVGTAGLPDLLRPLRQATLDGKADQSALPASLEEASQLLFLAEMQEGGLVTDLYRQAEGEAQIVIVVRDAGSRLMLPFLDEVDRYLASRPPPFGTAVSTGTTKLIQNYSAQVLRNFLPSLGIAIVLVLGIMTWMFRSVRKGLLALVPNLFPLLVLLAVMGIAGFSLKPATILVFSIAFGLAVDDTIHVLGRFRDLTNGGADLERALPRAVRDTGPAILMTSVIVSAGFALLMLSRFEVIYMVGLMTMVSAVTAVIVDLFVFPTLIGATRTRKTVRAPRRRTAARHAAAISAMALVSLGATQAGAQEVPPLTEGKSPEEQGLAIARAADQRTGGYQDYEAHLAMVLVSRDGRERVREMHVSALAVAGDGERTLLVFRSPRDLAGTALLSHSHAGGDDDQWLYLPSMKRVKRIAAAKQSGSFMGSEFAYEDISSGEVGNFTYRYEGEDRIGGTDVHVVDRFPVDEGSGYSRQQVYLDRATVLPLRIEYFDSRGAHVKTLTLAGYAQHGPYWRAATFTMENHRTGAVTRLEWSQLQFDTGLNERLFTPDGLGRRGR